MDSGSPTQPRPRADDHPTPHCPHGRVSAAWVRRVALSRGLRGTFEVVLAGVGLEVFGSEAEGGAVHGGAVTIEEGDEALAVVFAGFAKPSSDRRLHEVLRVVDEEFGDGEGVVEIVVADEVVGGGDRALVADPQGWRGVGLGSP